MGGVLDGEWFVCNEPSFRRYKYPSSITLCVSPYDYSISKFNMIIEEYHWDAGDKVWRSGVLRD